MAVVCSVRWAASLVAPAVGLRAAGWVVSSAICSVAPRAAPGVEAGSLGGLGGLFQMLQNAGLGDALNSWIGGGPNQSVSAADISRVFGDGQLQQLADSAGVSQGEAAEHLSSLLPELVNKLTPDGQAPQGDLDIGSLLARFS